MKEILLIYANGKTKTLSYIAFGKTLERIIGEIDKGKGVTYYKFLESELSKVYVDGKLVLDREKILENDNK